MEENKVATGGKGESMARENSYKHWNASEPLDYNAHNVKGFIEVSAPNDACFTALFPLRKDAEDYIAWKESGAECSRLASRVEELENAVRQADRVLFLLDKEVAALGCGADRVAANVKRVLPCGTCRGSGRVTVCLDEHGMQDDAPCPECKRK